MEMGNRSSGYVDSWLESFYWITFIMSWLGLPLMLKFNGWEVLPEHLTHFMVQIAFVGAVFYPLTALAIWRRGTALKPVQWSCVFGSLGVAVVFYAWLGEVFTLTVISIFWFALVLTSILALVRVREPATL